MRSLYWAGCWAPVGILNRCGRSSIGVAAFTNFAKIGWCTLLVALLAGYSTASGFGHLLALLSGYVTALLPFNLVADILGHLLTNFSWHLVTLFSWHLVALLKQIDNIECLNSKKFQQNELKENFKWPLMQIIKNKHCYLIHTWSDKTFKGTIVNRALPSLYGGPLDLFRLNSAIQNSQQWLLNRSHLALNFFNEKNLQKGLLFYESSGFKLNIFILFTSLGTCLGTSLHCSLGT